MRQVLAGRRRARATLVASAAAFGLFLAFGAGNALAFSCSGGTPTLIITMANETVTVSKGPASQIMANGAPCGGSVSDTDLIVVNGNGAEDTLVIDLGGGYFEPGATAEVAGVNEIEWRLGTSSVAVPDLGQVEFLTILGNNSADLITIGAGMPYLPANNGGAGNAEQNDVGNDVGTFSTVLGIVNMNDDEDADIFLDRDVSRPAISVHGRNGDDTLQGQGTKGTGGPATDDLLLAGNAGNDSLIGGNGDDWLVPGAGDDTVDGGGNYGPECDEDTLLATYTWDGDGDTVSFEDSPAGVTVDLDPGEVHPGSATGDGTDVLQNVENVNGSDFGDTISGNNEENMLWGGAGDDTLAGDAGGDCVWGEDGNDTLNENEGTPTAEGSKTGWENGADRLSGGAGADDVIDYSGRETRVVINLGLIHRFNDGADPNADSISEECDDVFFDTENARGGSGNDMISADFSNNQMDNEFWGGAGNDQLDLGAGNDTVHEGAAASGSDMMSGGGGSDTVDYSERTNAVMVSLDGVSNDGETGEGDNTASGMVSYGRGCLDRDNLGNPIPEPGHNAEATDTSSVENVEGGSGNDEIVGNESGNLLNGNAGNDVVRGGAGTDSLNGGDGDDTLEGGAGNDAMNGGEGTDWADYASAGSGGVGVQVNLTTGSATGDGNDTLSGIENASGSSFADSLRGDAGNNVLNGRGGDDAIQGLAGDDTINGGSGADELGGGAGADSIAGGNGADSLRGNAGDDTLQGGPGADTLMGGGGDDSLSGNSGKDFHKGGPGSDRCNPGTPGLGRGDVAVGCES